MVPILTNYKTQQSKTSNNNVPANTKLDREAEGEGEVADKRYCLSSWKKKALPLTDMKTTGG